LIGNSHAFNNFTKNGVGTVNVGGTANRFINLALLLGEMITGFFFNVV